MKIHIMLVDQGYHQNNNLGTKINGLAKMVMSKYFCPELQDLGVGHLWLLIREMQLDKKSRI